MKRYIAFFLVVFLTTNVKAQKPISIETSDFLFYQHIKNSVQNIIVPFSILNPQVLGSVIGKGDTNMTWDFSKISYVREEQAGLDSAIAYPSNAPLASDSEYTKANVVLMDINANKPTTYLFLQMAYDGIYNLGMTQDSAGILSKISGWSPPLEEQAIPIRYGNSWQNASSFSGASLGSGETRTVSVQAKVDGWGTMLLPHAYTMPALRVKKQKIVTYSKEGLQSIIDTTFEYDFISYFVYQISIVTDSKNVIQSAEYTINSPPAGVENLNEGMVGFTISKNPASASGTKIEYSLKNAGHVKIEVIDELGKSVRILQDEYVSSGEHIIPILPGLISDGVYLVRLVSPEMTAMKKLIIVR